MWTPNRVFVAFGFICVSTLGCDSADRERDEARRFLAVHEAIRYDAPIDERSARLAELERVVLGEGPVREVRDLCVSAHRALLKEQQAQEANAAQIEAALAGAKAGEPLDPQTVARLKSGLGDSEASIARARESLHECEDRARSLGLRFGRR